MAAAITMPRLSDSMEEGTVVRWLVDVGAPVERGQALVEIDTDKATMDYEAEVAGTLLATLVEAGHDAPVGAVIAWIGEPGEQPPPARCEHDRCRSARAVRRQRSLAGRARGPAASTPLRWRGSWHASLVSTSRP